MAWRIIEEGVIPSLPLGRVKAALRIHHDVDDELLRHLIHVARQYIETYTSQVLGDVKLELIIDRWERSKQPWSGLTPDSGLPVVWIPLPTGPLRTLESISLRHRSGEWTDLPLERFIVGGHRLGIRPDWPPITSGIHSICIIGRGGLTPVPEMVEGTWLRLVSTLYESDAPDMSVVQSALKPLSALKVRTLI
ncbi:MAG: hypothetical protein FJX95_08955 [Bacteroidetes bacterium]|nr:hypothetical protein [Bacteroidota bacterium]